MVTFQRVAASLYVADPAAHVVIGFLTKEDHGNALTVEKSWTATGAYLVGVKPGDWAPYASALAPLLADRDLRFIGVEKLPTTSWRMSARRNGNAVTLVGETTIKLRQLELTLEAGTVVVLRDDVVVFENSDHRISLKVAPGEYAGLAVSLELPLTGDAAGTLRSSCTLAEKNLDAAGEGISYFHLKQSGTAREIVRTTFRVLDATTKPIGASVQLDPLRHADPARTFLGLDDSLHDSHAYLHQGHPVRLRASRGARWVLGDSPKLPGTDRLAWYCLVPTGSFEVVRPRGAPQLASGRLLVGRSGTEYLNVALGSEAPTRAGGGTMIELVHEQPAYIGGEPTKPHSLKPSVVTAGVRIAMHKYRAQHEQAALHHEQAGRYAMPFREVPLDANGTSELLAFAPFGAVPADAAHAVAWDASILGPTRRKAFSIPARAPGSMRAVSFSTTTTPHGLVVKLDGDVPFSISVLASDVPGVNVPVSLELDQASRALIDGVMREKVFAVVANDDKAACGKMKLRLSVAGWAFDAEGKPKADADTTSGAKPAPPPSGTVLFKFYEGRSIEQLIESTDLWSYPAPPASGLVDKLKQWVKDAKQGETPQFDDIRNVISNPSWQGVLLVDYTVDLPNAPADVRAITATIPALKAHHLGLRINQVKRGDTGGVAQGRASMFGLISYEDKSSTASTSDAFDFIVRDLKLKFENSAIAYFRCKADFVANKLFYDVADKKASGDVAANTLPIEGRYESRPDEDGQPKDVYVFLHEQDHVFEMPKASPLDKITLKRVQITTVKDAAGKIQARFGISGAIACRKLPGDFDPFGIDLLSFDDLGVVMNVIANLPKPDFHFDPSAVRLDLDPAKLREGLLKSFPLRLRGLLFAGGELPLDLKNFGFWPLKLGGFGGGEFTFAFSFDLDLGLPGGFAPPGHSLTVKLALGWRPGGGGFAFGLGLPSLGGGRREFGLQGVLRLVAEDFEVKDTKFGIGLMVQGCRLEILGVSIPREKGFDGWVVVPSGKGEKVAWFAAMTGAVKIGEVFELEYLGLGQRVKPADGLDHCFDVVEDFKNVKTLDDALGHGRYDQSVGWTIVTSMKSKAIGARLQLAFSDPKFACFRIDILAFTLDASYRRVSDDVGVFAIDAKLPFGPMEFGAVSISLPSIGLDVFTNGDFRVDVGFPKGNDWSRSCNIQAFPFIGYGGFHLAKLSGKTSQLLTDAAIKPVLQAGIAARIGLGKTFEMGPLRAGISVTVFGSLEGALGYREGHTDLLAPSDIAIFARVGLLAEIYGYVDFGIVKASVSIQLSAEVGIKLLVEMGDVKDLTLYVAADVTVAVEVVIARIRIFGHKIEIKISFHFRTELRFEWKVIKSSSRATRALRAELAKDEPKRIAFRADRVIPDGEPLPKLPLWFVADATASLDAPRRAECVVFAALSRTPSKATDGARTGAPAAFDTLAEVVLRWVLKLADVGRDVTKERLDEIDADLGSHETLIDMTGPLDASVISELIVKNFDVQFLGRPAGNATEPGAFFPLFPDLRIRAEHAGVPVHNVDLAKKPALYGRMYRRALNARFTRLFEEARESSSHRAAADDPVSLPVLMYQDYFAALVKGVVREARDAAEKSQTLDELLVKVRDRLPRLALLLSRFFMHGLRIETLAGGGESAGMTPLFRALGQQFPFFDAGVPAAPAGHYVVTVSRPDGTTVTETVDGPEGFALIRALESAPLVADLTVPKTDWWTSSPLTFSLAHAEKWQHDAQRDLHLIPEDLARYTATHPAPALTMLRGVPDGRWDTKFTDAGAWRSALRIDLTLDRVNGPGNKDLKTYRVRAGVKDDQRVALRAVLEKGDPTSVSVLLHEVAGLRTLPLPGAYIVRVDLTTRPKPATRRALAVVPDKALLTDTHDFLEVLAEQFVVSSSGYYLVTESALPGTDVSVSVTLLVELDASGVVATGANTLILDNGGGATKDTIVVAEVKGAQRHAPRFEAGCAGFQIDRSAPAGDATERQLATLYNFIDYSWPETAPYRPLDADDALPIGAEGDEGATWTYKHSLPLWRFVTGDQAGSHYASIGKQVTLSLGLRDLYGNRVAHATAVPLTPRYCDPLIPLTAVRGIRMAFASATGGVLAVSVTYVREDALPPAATDEMRTAFIKRFRRATEQIQDPNVTMSVTSGLGVCSAIAIEPLGKFLGEALANLEAGSGPPEPITLATKITVAGDLLPITLALTFERTRHLEDRVKVLLPEAWRITTDVPADVDRLSASFAKHFDAYAIATSDTQMYAVNKRLFGVHFADATAAQHFAIPPLAKTPMSAKGVAWFDVDGQVQTIDAADVDVDGYAREYLGAIEQFLTPQRFVGAARAQPTEDPASVLGMKRTVAKAFAARVLGIHGEPDVKRAAKEVSDLVLQDLDAAYTTSTIVDLPPTAKSEKRPGTFLFGEVKIAGRDGNRCKAPPALLELDADKALTLALQVAFEAASKVVVLDLAIDVTHIGEAEPGDPRPTCWYRLEHPVHIPIGDRIEIPVPLRRLVTPPVLYDHTCTPAPLAGTETQRFKDGPLYDYAVIADWVKVAQDVIYLKVDYGDAEAVRAAASEPLIRALIEFHHTYGSVMKQLTRIGVDAPDHAMRLAIEVFIRAAQKVANAFEVTRGGFRARAAAAGSEEYKIYVENDQIDHIKGEVIPAEKRPTGADVVLRPVPPSAPAPTEPWVRRRITFPSVDITTYDSAWAEIHLKRNEELLAGRKVVDAFVYETAPARFGKPVTPFIQRPEELDASRLGPGTGRRPLAEHLGAILDGVVSKARVFDLRATYRFAFPGEGAKRGHQSTTPLSVLTATPISPGEVVQTAAKLACDLLVDLRAMSAAAEGAVVLDLRLHTPSASRAVLRWERLLIPLDRVEDLAAE